MANLKTRKNKKKAGELYRPPQYSNLYVNIPDNYLRLPALAQTKPITPRSSKTPSSSLVEDSVL